MKPFNKKSKEKGLDFKSLEEDGTSKRTLTGGWEKFIFFFALAMALFHIYALVLSSTTAWYLYCVHVGAGSVMTFALYRGNKKSPVDKPSRIDIILMILVSLAFAYMYIEMNTLVYRIGVNPTITDLMVAVIVIICVLEITRRTCGNILPIIAGIFLAYAKFGHLLPGNLGHRFYSWEKVLSFQLGTDALFSSSVQASATYVFLFLLFGAYLQESGCGEFFISFANSVAGASRGGPAKVAIISSVLFGTVSGNSVANVVTTGAFTIPLMKSIGYKPRFAAAVEATSSTGGQIMPPILGSAAFIMAALIGEPYKNIMLAAVIPAVLYFYTVFMMVDLEAAKIGLHGLPKNELPNLKIIGRDSYLLLPLAVVIITMTVFNVSPIRAAVWGSITAIATTWIKKESKMGIKRFFSTMSTGAQSACSLVASTATAGMVVGVLNMTGAGLKLASGIVNLSGGHLFPALLMTMVACVIMGMGLPTTASYLICVSVAAPALIDLGVPTLAAHMFVFYFACLSAITPPVALAAYAGAAIAKTKPMPVAITACKLGISAFIVPFMFAYAPQLIMIGTAGQIIQALITSLIGVTAISIGLQRYAIKYSLTMIESIIFIIAALLLMYPGLSTDIIGLILCVLAVLLLIFRKKSRRDQSET